MIQQAGGAVGQASSSSAILTSFDPASVRAEARASGESQAVTVIFLVCALERVADVRELGGQKQQLSGVVEAKLEPASMILLRDLFSEFLPGRKQNDQPVLMVLMCFTHIFSFAFPMYDAQEP